MSDPVTIHVGDVREGLAKIPAGSVQCCVTSPPYWGLRDYGVDGQIGLEDSPDAYVAAMVEVFRGVRRALRDDGVVFLNVGDSYSGGTTGRVDKQNGGGLYDGRQSGWVDGMTRQRPVPSGLKPKDLCMVPWRLALALQADGWWLRSVIVWAKKSPMPESVTDRPTSAWEPIFLLAKGQWSSRSIRFADLPTDRVHLGRHIGSKRPYAGPTNLCVRLASAIFDLTQSEHDFGLPAFYSEVWKQTSEGGYSDLVAGLPPQHRAAAYAARFLDGDTTAKEFLGEIHGLLRGLSNRDHLLIGGGLSERGLSPSALVNGDASITIHDAGKVSKIDFVHGQIIDTVPIGCRYFYDAEAVKEEAQPGSADRYKYAFSGAKEGLTRPDGGERMVPEGMRELNGRNQRNVWHLGPEPYSEAHFATFPSEIPRRAIMAGTSEKGCCPACRAPWTRLVERGERVRQRHGTKPVDWYEATGRQQGATSCLRDGLVGTVRTAGWQPGCDCNAGAPVPCLVLDPFLGSGTTIAVARQLGRHGVGCELNPKYVELAKVRIGKAEKPHTFQDTREADAPLFGTLREVGT